MRLRVTCALLLPLLTGSLGHMLLAKEAYDPGFGVLKALWTDGVALHSGGAVSGSLAVGFVAVFSKYAALPIFALLTVIAVMIALRLTPAALWEKLRERPQYEPEPEPEPKTPAIRLSAPEPVRRSEPERPKPQIDFPLDDAPAAKGTGEDLTPPEQEKKEGRFTGFFRHKSDQQKTPDQVIAGESAGEKKPAAPPAREPERAPEEKPAAQPVQAPLPAAPEPAASGKKAAARAGAAATAAVTAEIEQKMAEEEDAYQFPPITLLRANRGENHIEAGAELRNNARRLSETLVELRRGRQRRAMWSTPLRHPV